MCVYGVVNETHRHVNKVKQMLFIGVCVLSSAALIHQGPRRYEYSNYELMGFPKMTPFPCYLNQTKQKAAITINSPSSLPSPIDCKMNLHQLESMTIFLATHTGKVVNAKSLFQLNSLFRCTALK